MHSGQSSSSSACCKSVPSACLTSAPSSLTELGSAPSRSCRARASFSPPVLTRPPVRLGDDAYAKAGGLEHASENPHREAGMIDVSVSGHEHDVDPVPAAFHHFVNRHREWGVAQNTGLRGELGYVVVVGRSRCHGAILHAVGLTHALEATKMPRHGRSAKPGYPKTILDGSECWCGRRGRSAFAENVCTRDVFDRRVLSATGKRRWLAFERPTGFGSGCGSPTRRHPLP